MKHPKDSVTFRYLHGSSAKAKIAAYNTMHFRKQSRVVRIMTINVPPNTAVLMAPYIPMTEGACIWMMDRIDPKVVPTDHNLKLTDGFDYSLVSYESGQYEIPQQGYSQPNSTP